MSRWILAAILVLACSGACRAREQLSTSYCVVVAAMEPDAEALYAVVDPFAKANGLRIDVSPTAHFYEDEAETTFINVDRMGPLGAVISLYSLTDGPSAFEAPLRALVEDQVRARWTVRRCQDVEGFKGPWLFR